MPRNRPRVSRRARRTERRTRQPRPQNSGPASSGVIQIATSNETFRMAECARLSRMGVGAPRVLPDTMRVFFCYTYSWGDTTADPGFFQSVFRGNDPRQPMNSGATHQPRYWDQLVGANLYTRYLVLGSSISWEFKNDLADAARMCILPSTVTTSFTNVPEASEARDAKSAMVDEGGSGRGLRTLSHSKSTQSLFTLTYRDRYMAGAHDTAPTTIWYWHLYSSPFATSGTAADAQSRIKIVYDTLLFAPGNASFS